MSWEECCEKGYNATHALDNPQCAPIRHSSNLSAAML